MTTSITSTEKQDMIEELSQDHLIDYTKQIAQYVRLSGSQDEENAFKYIKDLLESYQLSPKLTYDDAFISIPKEASLTVNNEQFECITHSMAASATELTGDMLFISKDDLHHLSDIDGTKVALIEGLATPGIVYQIEKTGFQAAIFINTEYTYEMIVSPVWGTPTPENVEKLPKIPVISVTAPSGEKLKEQAQQGSSCTLSTSVDTGIRKIPTLTVDIQSDQEEDSFILFSGHVDSWHYGAMDNGTANATMLEVARVLAKNKHLLKRNVRLAFWSGHSHGRYAGSALYCDTHWQELYDHCVAHVNIDSVGGNGATVLSQGNCMAETKNIAQKAVYEVTEQDFEGKRYGKAGDQSFWGTGVPSLFMGLSEQPPLDGTAANAHQELFGQSGKSSGFGWWWHTTEDTTDKINPEFLLRDCQVYLLSILELACKDLLPINHIAALEDIKNGLQEWEGKLQGEMTLEELQQRVDSLIQRVESINILKNEPLTEAQLQTFNHLTMKLSRYFVPFNYVADNPFQFDTLFQLPRVPALLDIDALQKVSPQDEAAFFIKTKIRRKINELSFQLNQANQEINRFYETLKKE